MSLLLNVENREDGRRKGETLAARNQAKVGIFEGIEVRGRIFALQGILIYDRRVVLILICCCCYDVNFDEKMMMNELKDEN